jgi:hypothetical protein
VSEGEGDLSTRAEFILLLLSLLSLEIREIQTLPSVRVCVDRRKEVKLTLMEGTELVSKNDLVIRRTLGKLSREELVEVMDVWEESGNGRNESKTNLSPTKKESSIENEKKPPYHIYAKKELIDYMIRHKMVRL